MAFDWHGGTISQDTPIDAGYRNTQNVRRFLTVQCGPGFRFTRSFMAWIRDGSPKTMKDVVAAWKSRQNEVTG